MSKIQEVTQALRNSISQVILGKEDVVDKLLAALLCGGHVFPERERLRWHGHWRSPWRRHSGASSLRRI